MQIKKGYWESKGRIWEIDFLRGLSILLMIVDHIIFDLADLFFNHWQMGNGGDAVYNALNIYQSDARYVFHVIFLSLFILLSGISTQFSHNKIKRAIKLSIVAVVITVFTYIIKEPIYFGIIQLLSVCLWIEYFLTNIFKKRNRYTYGIVCLIFAFILFEILARFFPYHGNKFLSIFSINLRHPQFESADYVPIFLNVPIFFIGVLLGNTYKERKSFLPFLDLKFNIIFNWCGKHSLLIYLIHQPLIIIVLELITVTFITPGHFAKLV